MVLRAIRPARQHYIDQLPKAILKIVASINLRDLVETLSYPPFWKLIGRHWHTAAGEVFRSLSKRAFAKELSTLVPDITADDLVSAPAGVRSQALFPNGQLADDFLIVEKGRSFHVCNAPSPAATASLAIAEEIVARAAELLRR